MSRPLVIVGCGGFGREVRDVVAAINAQQPQWDLLGYVDDSPSDFNRAQVARQGPDILGGLSWLVDAHSRISYVIGIGSPTIRAKIADRLGDRHSATLVHPAAIVSSDASLGAGTVVCAGSVINTNVTIGQHVHINPLCNIGHDAFLDSFVSVNPMVAVSGNVHVGRGVLLGSHSVVLQGLTISDGAVVGAAACVVRKVGQGQTVKGVPAS